MLENLAAMLPSPEMRGYKLLILDGHEAHISLHAAQVAVAKIIDIAVMPSCATLFEAAEKKNSTRES